MNTDTVKLKHLILCDYSTVGRDGKMSAIGIFDKINIPEGMNSVIQTIFVVGQIIFPPLEEEISSTLAVRIVGPNFIAEETLEGKARKGSKSIHFGIKFDLLEFRDKGEYTLHLFFAGKEITERMGSFFQVR